MQCCLDLPEPTLHKKNTSAMLAHSSQTTLGKSHTQCPNTSETTFHKKIPCAAMILREINLHNFVLVCLGQDCTKQQPVQCRNSQQRCSV